MKDNKSIKALKKQMAAAVAMVLVAAIALGSSTFAWFVSNNTVKATTTTIAAQSNAAFMVIDKTETTTNSGTEDAYTGDNTALYPAKVDASTAAVTDGSGEKGYVWQSAFATAGDKSDMKSGTLFDIQGTASGSGESAVAAAATGTAAAAVQSGFAIKQTFYIGEKTGTTELANLRVSAIAMTGDSTENDLTTAMRVLIVCGDKWIVYNKDMAMQKTNITETDGKYILRTDGFKGVGATNQVTVDMYVYYDGDDTKVYTTNLANLVTNHGLTVSFTADNMAAGGSTGSTGTATTTP